jgi:MerR family transcriptional regulator, light-induced transcriptional regulator
MVYYLSILVNMNQFSISDIETLSGIKAHTLRIWEQRYKFLTPARKESRHRIYSNEDLKSILRISYLYHKGLKISKIAALSEQEICKRSLETEGHKLDFEIYINRLTEASIDLNQELFEEITDQVVSQAGYESSVLKVFFPLLNKIGLLWMVDSVTPAQEHFASAIIIKKMLAAIQTVPRIKYVAGQPRVLIFTPESELHEMPMLFMQYQLRKHGIPVIQAGKNSSLTVIKNFVEANDCTHLYFHLVTNLIHSPLEQYLLSLSSLFPTHKIYFSGAASPSIHIPANVHFLRNQQAVADFVFQL